jgi:hypothetical protein
MRRFAVLMCGLFVSVTIAQAQLSSGGSQLGVGVGFYSFRTTWYYYNYNDPIGSREHYPAHIFNRTILFAYYESPSLLPLGPFDLSLRGEAHFGIAGGTKEDWLPLGETISSGGSTYGGVAGVKLAYRLVSLPAVAISPYVLPAFHFTLLNSNGEDVGTQFANRASYQYSGGWDETVYGASLGIGVNVELVSIVIAPEYRFFLGGGAGTDWTPGGVEPTNDGPSFGAFTVSVGFKL